MMKAGKWIWDNNFHYYIYSECGVSENEKKRYELMQEIFKG